MDKMTKNTTRQQDFLSRLSKKARGLTNHPDGSKHFWASLTPDEATELLEIFTFDKQRGLKPKNLKRYTKRMSEGKWVRCDDPIVITKENQFLAGHHRLKSQIAVGLTLEWSFIIDAPITMRPSLEGGQQWSVADKAGLNKDQQAAVAVIYLLEGESSEVLDEDDSRRIWSEYGVDIDDVLSVCASPAWRKSPIIASFAIAASCTGHKTRVMGLLRELERGKANSDPGAAITRLVTNWDIKNNNGGRSNVACQILRGIHAHVTGEEISKLTTTPMGLNYFAPSFKYEPQATRNRAKARKNA